MARVDRSLTYGGTLALTTLAGKLSAEQCFQIFSAANFQGAFTNITPLIPW
jgi:hypothetical protein